MAAPADLGLEQGQVGVTDQLQRFLGMQRRQRHATTGGNMDFMGIDEDRLGDAGDHGLGETHGVFRRKQVGLEDGELVATDSRDRGAVGCQTLQPFGHLPQDAVTDRMAKGVVDVLEAIQIDHQHRRRPRLHQQFLGSAIELATVGQSGEHVDAGQLAQRFFLLMAGGEILEYGLELELALLRPTEQRQAQGQLGTVLAHTGDFPRHGHAIQRSGIAGPADQRAE